MKHKVLAYITRWRDDALQLLVFMHRDFPEAGVQVPAGTVEPEEPPEHALFREITEESGLGPGQLRLERPLGEAALAERQAVFHVFQLSARAALPDTWTHLVGGEGEDSGMAFEYHWVELSAGVELAGDQGQWLPVLIRSEAA